MLGGGNAVLMALCMMLLVSCSLHKNNATNRFWHAFTSRYNIYYNGTQAYIDASLQKEQGNKDNYTERIPLYTVGNKASRDLGKSSYDIAITKAQKAIQLHSIKAKPDWNKNRRKTERDVEWLSRKEYNPFLWRAWMLMGRSQFYKGEFDEAAATFSYMSRLYKGQRAIYGKAQAWLAKCYLESDWVYNAEDIIRNNLRDSIDWRAQKEWDYTLCDYYLHTDNLPMAAQYLRKVIHHEMRSKQRAREYYLLGQVEAAQGNRVAAYKAFRKVVRQNPPYELEFNARISMTEVMAAGQAKKMIGRLKRMARNDNNKEYLDQVYYAIGNIYLAEKDTANAIAAYEKGNEKATRSGIEKGVLLLHLGDLYWAKEKYGDAKRCYGEAIGLLDKERPDYEQLASRSKVLDELVPYTDAIALQDSLLELSVMPEKERNAAIDRVITALKKKEKEEAAKAAEAEVAKREQQYGNKNTAATTQKKMDISNMISNADNSGIWYFYSTQAVTQGKQTFQKEWGKRENLDDWQRINKTVVGGSAYSGQDDAANDATETPNDASNDKQSAQEDSLQEKQPQVPDSLSQDPHKREYYLAQIPFTQEAKQAAHEIIKDGLIHSAIIFKDKLDNLTLSEKAFNRLRRDYPTYEPKDEMYYHLFLLYSRMNQPEKAETFVDSLKVYYAQSKYTTLLTDPYFADNAKYGKHIEDSLYAATYEAFKADRFSEVYANNAISAKRFPLGDNRDRFLFLYGMTSLNDGNADTCLAAMQKIVKDYPKSVVSEMAGMLINGVQAGKRLHGAKFDLTNVWDRRTVTLNSGDSTAAKGFSDERNTDFCFIMAYAPDSINENQLLFQMARYNFTSFLVRNFDLDIEDMQGMHHLVVSGFRNFDEARQYARLLLQQEGVKKYIGNARPIVISEENLAMLGARYSYNDYDTFYVKHFAPLPYGRPEQLYEPTKVTEETGTREEPDPVKPYLPTEEVAPGGAKPEEAKKPEDEETEKSTESLIDITEPAEENAAPAEEIIDITEPAEVEKPSEEVIDVTEPSEPAKPAEEEFNVIEEPKVEQPTEETFDVEEPKPVEPTEETFDIEEPKPVEPAEETFDVEEPKPVEPTEETFEFNDEQPAEQSEDDTIIIEDEKQSSRDIEDEYYELDGF